MGFNYFIHRVDAIKDTAIQRIIDSDGLAGYGFWWVLLGIYAEFYFKGNSSINQEIHIRLICDATRMRKDSVVSKLLKLHHESLIILSEDCYKLLNSSNKDTSMIQLSIPNLLKYVETAKNNNEKNIIEKTIVKEKPKKKAIKIPKNDNFAKIETRLVELWNKMANENALPCVKNLNADRKTKLRKFIKEIPSIEDWEKIIMHIPKEPWNIGVNPRGWKANIDWLIRPTQNNPHKLLEKCSVKTPEDELYDFFQKSIYGESVEENRK